MNEGVSILVLVVGVRSIELIMWDTPKRDTPDDP
jgi:hypothetical protein